MDTNITNIEFQHSGVSWASVAAGAAAMAALTLLLLAFGAGIGLSAISPWGDSGVSATTFKVGTGIYLCCATVMASAVGGYLAARLRTRWATLHTNEVFFRDTAHGFIAWAFATVVSAAVLGGAMTHVTSGALAGAGVAAGQAAQNANPADIYVDKLLRPAAPAAAAANAGTPAPAGGAAPAGTAPAPAATASSSSNPDATRSEVLRLWTSGFRDNNDISAEDRTYLAQVIATRTGMSQAEAQKRVDATITDAKAAADKARKAAAQTAFWLTASLLLGAFAASLAAAEGGSLRDGTWNDRVLTPRTI